MIFKAEHDGGRVYDSGQEGLGTTVIAVCNPAPVFQATEHNLDAVVAAIPALVVTDSFAARFPIRDTGTYPLVFQLISEPVDAETPVGDQPFGSGQTSQQSGSYVVVADPPCRHEQLQGPSRGVDDGMQLGIQASLHAPNQTPALVVGSPFFACMPEVIQCAFRKVVSITTTFSSPHSEASPHHPGVGAHVAPPLPAIVEGLGWYILPRRVTLDPIRLL